jgi:hypothetical protein
LTDPKKREVLLHLSREKKIEFQERIYNPHVRLLSPEPWLVGTTKVYPGVGADIVMESITFIIRSMSAIATIGGNSRPPEQVARIRVLLYREALV